VTAEEEEKKKAAAAAASPPAPAAPPPAVPPPAVPPPAAPAVPPAPALVVPATTPIVVVKGPRMGLASIRSGVIDRVPMIGVYGQPGVGKTTFGASAPRPIFLGAERGTEHLNVARFPVPETWLECHDAITTLGKEKHDFDTLVFDSLDWAESLCWADVCREWGVTSIEAAGPNGGGFGKGYGEALKRWEKLLGRMEMLREKGAGGRGMNVILIAHATVRQFKNPAGADYNRYTMKLQEKATAKVTEAVGILLFAMFEERIGFVNVAEGRGPTGRIMSGAVKQRVFRTEYGAAWEAKCRPAIPDPLPFKQDSGWKDVMAARAVTMSPVAMEERARKLAAEVAPYVEIKVRDAIQTAIDAAKGNAPRLEALCARLVERLAESQKTDETAASTAET
jgi:hypothetical protein